MLQVSHPDDDVLEMFCMEKLEGTALEACEDHLILCAACQDRVMDTDAFLRGMQLALVQPDSEPALNKILDFFRMPVPVWATAAVALAGVGGVLITHDRATQSAPVAVALNATRGGTTSIVSSANSLDLDLDARDLPEPAMYQVQIVNADGNEVWSTQSNIKSGHVHAIVEQRLTPGQYYVRLADTSATRKEYSLRLGK